MFLRLLIEEGMERDSIAFNSLLRLQLMSLVTRKGERTSLTKETD
jgi:hypothetical protein